MLPYWLSNSDANIVCQSLTFFCNDQTVKVWHFSVTTKRLRLLSYVLYGLWIKKIHFTFSQPVSTTIYITFLQYVYFTSEFKDTTLYNEPGYSRILIGSCLWSITKKSCWGIEQVWEAGKSKKNPFLLYRMSQKQYSSSLSQQLSETKPNTKLILLCLEFNKYNKQSVCY